MTNIFSLTCVGVYLTFWAGLIAWTVRKHLPLPWDFLLAILIFVLSSNAITINNVGVIHGGWLAFLPLMVWPDSKPGRYFFRWQGIGKSLLYGLLAGVALALVWFSLSQFGLIGQPAYTTGFWQTAFSLFEMVVFLELAFRSLILGGLVFRGVPERTAILLQSALFVVYRMVIYVPSGEWAALIILAVGALAAGWITLRTRNIAGAILLHLMIYGASLLLAFYM